MTDALDPVRTGTLQRCEQAAQFVSLQTNLISDVSNVIAEVLFNHTDSGVPTNLTLRA
jgi:hypothetical protein